MQGAANTVNGVQDGLIGIANLPGVVYNNTVGYIPGAALSSTYRRRIGAITSLRPRTRPGMRRASSSGARASPFWFPGSSSPSRLHRWGRFKFWPKRRMALGPRDANSDSHRNPNRRRGRAAAAVAAEVAAGNVIQMTAGMPEDAGGAGENAPNSGAAAAAKGLARENQVAEQVAGSVSRQRLLVKGLGSTDLDVLGQEGNSLVLADKQRLTI